MLVQEDVSLHGLEPGHLLHPHRRSLVADPHAEASLQNHPAQLAQVALKQSNQERLGGGGGDALRQPGSSPEGRAVFTSTFYILNHKFLFESH